ncbi:universal stress protein [Deinococcus sp.]|uniref:universal stress protein n=1 Tax=Deinococcus sp. TaxID=47478 RepID=UPI0025C47299|nr:universal stress protein [Deinococcus sp.]
MARILVTTDASPLGQQGVAHARALATALGAELTVLSVQTDPAPIVTGEFGYIVPLSEEELRTQQAALRDELTAAFPDTDVRIERTANRSVWQTILSTARSLNASMIVMTTHGRTGLGKMLLGSVAQAVVEHSTIPVLLVRGEQPVAHWS